MTFKSTAEAGYITSRSKCAVQTIDIELNFDLRTLGCRLLLGGINSTKEESAIQPLSPMYNGPTQNVLCLFPLGGTVVVNTV